jgi:hypothetical protein
MACHLRDSQLSALNKQRIKKEAEWPPFVFEALHAIERMTGAVRDFLNG